MAQVLTDAEFQTRMLDALEDIKRTNREYAEGRKPFNSMVAIGQYTPVILDYRDRKHVYIFSALALTLSLEDLGLISIAANTWTDISFTPGLYIYAPGQTPNVMVAIKQTDDAISAPSVSSGGSGGSVTQGTTPWITQISNANANGVQPMSGSSPIVWASDQTPLVTGTGTKTNVSSSATSVTILAANSSRKGATFQSDSTQILYLDLTGGTASPTSYTVPIQPGGFYELPPMPIYDGAITGIWAAANGTVRVTEFS